MPLDNTNWSATEADETTALLIRARSFVERGWCRDALARDAWGDDTNPCGDRAVAWCAYGALIVAGVPKGVFHPAILRLAAATGVGQITLNCAHQRLQTAIGREISIATFNDRQHSAEPVLAAFDRAIALAEQEQRQ